MTPGFVRISLGCLPVFAAVFAVLWAYFSAKAKEGEKLRSFRKALISGIITYVLAVSAILAAPYLERFWAFISSRDTHVLVCAERYVASLRHVLSQQFLDASIRIEEDWKWRPEDWAMDAQPQSLTDTLKTTRSHYDNMKTIINDYDNILKYGHVLYGRDGDSLCNDARKELTAIKRDILEPLRNPPNDAKGLIKLRTSILSHLDSYKTNLALRFPKSN
jgi:hypothetical protein